MKEIVLKQRVSIASKAIFLTPIFFSSIALTIVFPGMFFAIMGSLFLFGFNYEYLIKDNFDSYIRIRFLKLKLLKFKKNFIYPEYISLFKQPYKTVMGYGFHTPYGEDKLEMYTIKFFDNKKRETIFKSNNKEEVLCLGKDLAEMLNVELHNNLV